MLLIIIFGVENVRLMPIALLQYPNTCHIFPKNNDVPLTESSFFDSTRIMSLGISRDFGRSQEVMKILGQPLPPHGEIPVK